MARHKDETIIDGYEVEAEKFDPQQWWKMVNSRMFDRVWIVVPSQTVSEVERFIAADDSLKRVGIIAYFGSGRFGTVKEAEMLASCEKCVIKIKIEP